MQLSRERLIRIIAMHPKDATRIRSQAIWLALRREMINVAREVKKRGGRRKSEQEQLLHAAMTQRREGIMAAEKMSKAHVPDSSVLVESSTHDLVTSLIYLVFEMKSDMTMLKKQLAPPRSGAGSPGLGQGFDSHSYKALASNAAMVLSDEERGPRRSAGSPSSRADSSSIDDVRRPVMST